MKFSLLGKDRAPTVLVFSFIIVASASLGFVYVHDNPSGITPITDINSENVSIGERVTVKGVIVEILMLFMGPHDQVITITDNAHNLMLFWAKSRVEIGWCILAEGTIGENGVLYNVTHLERVWLF